jgi:hypothetical protein
MATELEQYIRQAAKARGIDADIAVRVAKSEGGLNDPTRRAEYVKGGYREPSYGPFQLLIGGPGTGFPTGMGNDALRAGIDPRDPANAYKGIDFALDQAKNSGWGAWYGARDQGITGKMGIGGNPAPAMSPQAADFVKNNPQPGGFGLPVEQAVGLAPATPPPVFGSMMADNSIDPNVAKYASADEKDTLGNRMQKAGKAFDDAIMPAPRPGPFPGGPSAAQAGGLLKATDNIKQLAQMLMQRRIS